ncbi:MAG: hypothetical protein PVF45_10350, partial [Anaerolineae bacterium]
MNEREFFNQVTNSRSDFLHEFLQVLEETQASFCVIGGLAVNAYAEPVISLDLDLVVIAEHLEALVVVLEHHFSVKRFPHSVNVYSAHSDLRIQIQTDARYQPFVARAESKTVLGYSMPVAALEDVIRGKVWAFSDPTRRASKRQKDLADVLRLVEAYPHLLSAL